MTSARPSRGEEVHTTATLTDGTEVEGDAWFRVDAAAQHLEWGASNYHGYLDVTGHGEHSSTVAVHLHTTRVDPDDPQVQQGVEQTLVTIKHLVEERDVVAG